MTPQQIAILASAVAFLAGFANKLGWIDEDTYKWLVSPETVTSLSVIVGGGIAAYGLVISRKHGLIKSTAALPQVDAVVVAPKTAGEIPTDNVVATAEAAEPFVKARKRRVAPVVPPAANS